MRPARAVLLAALVLAPLFLGTPAAQAQEPVDLYVNVVSARSFGCSPDSFTSPDLRVLVFVNDAPAVETVKAQDQREPLYASLVRVSATLPARISVEVQEAEPSGLFGTSWVTCDTAPGAATRYTHTYNGDAAEAIAARGDDAEAVIAVGRVPPALPAARVSNVTDASADLSWEFDRTFGTTSYRIARTGAGGTLAALSSNVTSAKATDLCDNLDHSFRIVRDAPPWSVATNVTFRTLNVAPAPPRVLSATPEDGNVTVAWEAADVHDAARFELLVGATREPAEVRATVEAGGTPFASFRESVPLRSGDAWVRVRLVDTGGLSSVSESFGIGAPELSAETPFARRCDATLSPGPSVAVPSPVRVSPTNGTAPFGGVQVATPSNSGAGDVERGRVEQAGLLPDWAVLVLVFALGAAMGVAVMLAMRR